MPIRVTQRDWWNVYRILVAVAAFDVAAVIVAVVLNAATDDRAPLAAGLAAVGLVTFFGLVLAQMERLRQSGFASGEFGLAVVATVLVVYLCLLSFTVFDSSAVRDESLGGSVFSDFTTFAAIVVGFFVAASAISQITQPRPVPAPAPERASVPAPAASPTDVTVVQEPAAPPSDAETVEQPPPKA